ncbi:MAG TPA: hypothetical protein VMT75_02315 [Candidatus Saccharimonadales bacterium]|nr:hypothetical protein [Candidatus Saccharimonadales bacterium]
MKTRVLLCFALVLLSCASAWAQQAPTQPLTFWYEYTVNPGKEDQFLELVKTVGAPVRDKLMADGVVLAWGVQTPVLRVPGNATHSIWYAVADWSGVEKVQNAMQAQIAKLTEEAAKGSVAKKGGTAAQGPMDRVKDIADVSKTHDYLTRDLVFKVTQTAPPAGLLPYTRFNFVKVKPGKAAEYRKAWERYNKPVLDKLLADGVIGAYGLSVEEVRTSGEFTHFTWWDTPDLAAMEKVRAAFIADRDHRSQEEQSAIVDLFTGLTDPDAARSEVDHAVIFRAPSMK